MESNGNLEVQVVVSVDIVSRWILVAEMFWFFSVAVYWLQVAKVSSQTFRVRCDEGERKKKKEKRKKKRKKKKKEDENKGNVSQLRSGDRSHKL